MGFHKGTQSLKLVDIAFLLFGLGISNMVFSQELLETPVKDPAKIIEQINLFSQNTNTITSDFTQVKEMSFMEEKRYCFR